MHSRTVAFVSFALFVASPANASPVSPTDYFSQAIASAPLNGQTGSFVSPQPGVNTGQIAAPIAQVTNPVTTLYGGIPGVIGPNISGQGPVISTGSASATADRATGQLHAAAGATSFSTSAGFGAGATAQFGDTLTWTALGASSTTLTTIGFSFHIDGTLSPTGFGSGQAEGVFSLAIGSTGCFTGGFCPTVSSNAVGRGFSYTNTWYGQPGTVTLNLSGTFSFTGQTATIPILMSLFAGGQYAFADFSDTATFAFASIPTNVSFTSASGDFLTGAETPLPTALPLFAGGLGVIGLLARRRKQLANA